MEADSERGEAVTRQIGILLFEDVEELDAIGPWEVLSFWATHFPEDGYGVLSLSERGGLIRCAKGLVVKAQYSYVTVPPLEVLVYPGGPGTRPQLEDEEQLTWVRRQRQNVPLLTSVCTGSLVYAAAGILTAKSATTHRESLGLLAEIDPSIDVLAKERFVDAGSVITAAGVSAGIDMALHLVARLAGHDRANEVRYQIQYEPGPSS